jgi:hypothetical protein
MNAHKSLAGAARVRENAILQATSVAINPWKGIPLAVRLGFEAVMKAGNTPAELPSMLGKH